MSAQKAIEKKADVSKSGKSDKVKILLDGECKGVKGATAYKIAEYAQKKGLV